MTDQEKRVMALMDDAHKAWGEDPPQPSEQAAALARRYINLKPKRRPRNGDRE